MDDAENVDTDNDGIGNNADTDDDNDNLPDAYETANNLNPLDGSDAQQDADNDGSSNIAEFEAGSDPNNPNSTPATPGSRGGGSIGLLWMFFSLTLMLMRRRINATSSKLIGIHINYTSIQTRRDLSVEQPRK